MSRRPPFAVPLVVAAVLAVLPASLRSQTPPERHALNFSVREDQAPQHRDCQIYNPDTLTIERLDSGVWRVQDGGHYLTGLGSEAEGRNALALMQRFREMCFIGRMNRRPAAERGDYILTYWQGASGKQTAIDPEQCQTYDPAKLHMVNREQSDGS